MRILLSILALALFAGVAMAFDVPQMTSPTQPIFGFGQAPIGVGDKIITPPASVPIFGFGDGPIPVGNMIITPLGGETIFGFGE